MLYVLYVYLKKRQEYSQKTTPFSIQTEWYIRTMTARVQLQKKSQVVGLKSFDAKTNWLAVNRQS
jgi:hypothetical protein